MGVCGGGRWVLKGVEFVGKTVKYMNSINTIIKVLLVIHIYFFRYILY